MASVNKVILVGNLGADPEVRYLPSGDAVANIRLATTDRYKDKASGEFKETTEWHRVVFYRRLAEIVQQYVKKGSALYIEGRGALKRELILCLRTGRALRATTVNQCVPTGSPVQA